MTIAAFWFSDRELVVKSMIIIALIGFCVITEAFNFAYGEDEWYGNN